MVIILSPPPPPPPPHHYDHDQGEADPAAEASRPDENQDGRGDGIKESGSHLL